MTTTTKVDTLAEVLTKADPDQLADALRKVDLGMMLTPRKVTFAGLTSAAAQDITTAAALAKATCSPALPASVTGLPPIAAIRSLRITAGTAHTNNCVLTDTDGTATDPASGISEVKLSDDGKTLTFGAAVTGFVIEYIPRPVADVTAKFAPSTYTA